MGFLDKLKDAAATAAEKAKETVDNAKANYEYKKLEAEQHRQEMEAIAASKVEQILGAIRAYENGSGVFSGISKQQLLSFTKEFFDKIFLPANSVNRSKVQMYPYIDEKQINRFCVTWRSFNREETPLVYLKTEGKQEILITDATLYFSIALEEDPKFFAKGEISCDEISKFSVCKGEKVYQFKCDEFVLGSFAEDKSIVEDFITLNNYFECISKQDFEITEEEVDQLIREKIGEKVYTEIKKYMVFDDERMVYFAWGLDSLSAKDYIVCTNKQIIRMDRELFGATANVKQFYYEDIVSASTEQNSSSSSLTGVLLDAAITAATKTCDLVISTAGTPLRISNLFKVEAERVVAVYHQFRKEAKMASAQPQVIVQQQVQVDPLEQLKKLSEMKDMGIITEEEFNAKKADLLAKI